MSDDRLLRHKHLYTFLNFWDENHDGILSWDDFVLLAEKFAKIQRRGKLEKEVFERWKAIFEKWWNELTSYADANKDKVVEFHEWLDFFKTLGKNTKKYEELPEFLKTYLHLFFLCSDANKDGLFCLKDYKKYIASQKMDASKAEEHFNFMLNEEDAKNGNAMSSDRFKELVYDFWTSNDETGKGKYICGPFDLTPAEELQKRVKAKP
ncbi:Sre1 cleavage activating protein, Scap scp1 [Tyrophagus putrescentiae]|nr:Sre1 cleavage activating protein, Scap scp1 [Tyrophagus putrescentiae]